MKLDILAFGAHPDDVELSAAGTIMREISQGKKAGIIDLTRGELGTRGTPEQRDAEAAVSSEILGISIRANLGFRDGFFRNDEMHQLLIIKYLRLYRPEIVICNAISDRHIDHGRASSLVSDSCFLSGLRKIKSYADGKEQEAWRPAAVYHYIQDRHMKPDFVVDVTEFMEKKMKAVKAFESQFYKEGSDEPETAISSKDFLDFLVARAMEFGRPAGFRYAEGFVTERIPGIKSLNSLF